MAEHVFTDDEIRQIIDVINRTKHTQYIGARYVPIFGRKNEESIEWDNSKPYEPLTIVLYQGDSYTTRQFTPAGIDINNKDYWANTGNYNAQIEQYRQTVNRYRNEVKELENTVNTKFNEHDTRITTNKNNIDINKSDIDSLREAHNGFVAGEFNALSNNVKEFKNTVNTELNEHDTRITTNKNNIDANKNNIDANKSDIDSLSNELRTMLDTGGAYPLTPSDTLMGWTFEQRTNRRLLGACPMGRTELNKFSGLGDYSKTVLAGAPTVKETHGGLLIEPELGKTNDVVLYYDNLVSTPFAHIVTTWETMSTRDVLAKNDTRLNTEIMVDNQRLISTIRFMPGGGITGTLSPVPAGSDSNTNAFSFDDAFEFNKIEQHVYVFRSKIWAYYKVYRRDEPDFFSYFIHPNAGSFQGLDTLGKHIKVGVGVRTSPAPETATSANLGITSVMAEYNQIGMADYRPIKYEDGSIMQEDGKVFICATVRGAGINSAYQGVFKVDPSTAHVEMIGALFNLRNTSVPYNDNAGNVIYDRNEHKWLIMFIGHSDDGTGTRYAWQGETNTDPRYGVHNIKTQRMIYTDGAYREDIDFIYYNGKWYAIGSKDASVTDLAESDGGWMGNYTTVHSGGSNETGTSFVKMPNGTPAVVAGTGDTADHRCRVYSFDLTTSYYLTFDHTPDARTWFQPIPWGDGDDFKWYVLSFTRDNVQSLAYSYGAFITYEGTKN